MAEIRPTRHQTKNGETFFIRSAQGKDAGKVLVCASQIIAERDFSLTSPEEFLIGVEQEIAFLEDFRKDPEKLFIVAENEAKVVIGTLDFTRGRYLRQKHTGEFGMGVLAEYRSQGVGAALLGGLLAWAQIQPGLEKINLTVHGDNTRALGLYKKFGFEIEGIRKRDTRFEDDRYVDSVEMAKFLTET